MSIDSEKLKRVLERNLNELSNCILKRRAYNSLLALKSSHNLNFFRVSAHALHNDLYADAHRVFDKHKDVTTFWYVQKVSPEAFSKAALAANVSVTELELIANKLVHLRDRLHFHIDGRDVMEPSRVWKIAKLSGNEFIKLTEGAHEILRRMYLEMTGSDSPVPNYHGDDIGKIIRAYKKVHPDAKISI